MKKTAVMRGSLLRSGLLMAVMFAMGMPATVVAESVQELLHIFAEFPDVVLDAGYEVCLDRVPVSAKPVWRHFREIGPFVLCFHAYSIA